MFLADLTILKLRGEDLEQACFFADEAAGQRIRAGYATNASRLQEFRPAVANWMIPIPVRTLDEQLTALGRPRRTARLHVTHSCRLIRRWRRARLPEFPEGD